jgi:hypothetical protein
MAGDGDFQSECGRRSSTECGRRFARVECRAESAGRVGPGAPFDDIKLTNSPAVMSGRDAQPPLMRDRHPVA